MSDIDWNHLYRSCPKETQTEKSHHLLVTLGSTGARFHGAEEQRRTRNQTSWGLPTSAGTCLRSGSRLLPSVPEVMGRCFSATGAGLLVLWGGSRTVDVSQTAPNLSCNHKETRFQCFQCFQACARQLHWLRVRVMFRARVRGRVRVCCDATGQRC